ncbi:nucleotidyl transferase AbiEii/AbiGii toxin family protein [Shewanella cyperi]|uniref:Nucleotidyl transferase AbiEii/AbiGii toxin family protein n=1 Tax=Shewanella cyperi TaxID=2814292 RepID=A0A974XL37_9GAMM|nr:nucleotidyl transferase AbiEii/AbiGii toxin family protein [Shewanella cyperi]QSX29006.1 nucleotidyl transferase AbiEii/AbiGii toxin family protein [Shewanella cyperi]
MSNIYTLKHSLKLGFKPVLMLIAATTKQTGMPFFVAGATARDIVLFNVFGRDPGRQTRDIDTGILVPDWEAFSKVKQALLDAGLTETKSIHRLQDPHSALPIDIIPFGGIAGDKGDIQWPPEHAVTMSVAGFQEAYDAALSVDIGQGNIIKVASLAGLTLLKLIAWQERGNEAGKDAADFLTVLLEYQHIQEDRLWEPFIPAERLNYDIERQGAFLLGYDLKMLLSEPATNPQTVSRIKALGSDLDRFVGALFKHQHTYGHDRIERLLWDFWTGLDL